MPQRRQEPGPQQHRRALKRLLRDEFTYREEPSIANATALMLTLIGLAAAVLLLL